jgi:excisionase family DNA binding protein
MKKEDDLATVAEVARILNVSKTTVWRMLQRGELTSFRIGKRLVRVSKGDLVHYIVKSNSLAVRARAKGEVVPISETEEDRLAEGLAQLLDIERKIRTMTARDSGTLADWTIMDLRNRIKEQLNRATTIARELGLSEFTVTTGIGFPPTVSISFDVPLLFQDKEETS